MSKIWEGLQQWLSRDRRRSGRRPAPGVAAYFWTGAPPKAHGIRDISDTGLYLVTEERWYLGTMVLMTLQTPDPKDPSREISIAVHSKAVRWGEDGVGLRFVLKDDASKTTDMRGADKKTLENFLRGFSAAQGRAFVDCVLSETTQSGR